MAVQAPKRCLTQLVIPVSLLATRQTFGRRRLYRRKLAFNALAHVQVSLVDHTQASIDRFQAFVDKTDQVLECASITGDFDYILKVAAHDK